MGNEQCSHLYSFFQRMVYLNDNLSKISCIWNSITHFEVEQILPRARDHVPLFEFESFP